MVEDDIIIQYNVDIGVRLFGFDYFFDQFVYGLDGIVLECWCSLSCVVFWYKLNGYVCDDIL